MIARLTLEEKAGLMSHPAKGVLRLIIPAHNYWRNLEKSKPSKITAGAIVISANMLEKGTPNPEELEPKKVLPRIFFLKKNKNLAG